MQTIFKGTGDEVVIDTDGPVILIGEKINPTGNKRLAQAFQKGDFDYVRQLATRQVEAGADLLDVNVGVPGADEARLLKETVKTVAEITDVPICLDSANPKALAEALSITPGKPLVNSVNGEEASLQSILPLVKEHSCAVIGLAMGEDGIPQDAEGRLVVAGKIIERAGKLGIAAEDVIIDPLVLSVSTDHEAASITLRTIERIRAEFGVSIILGASNVSFGLPERHTLNQSFLALALAAGANCLISDPFKLSMTLRATDLLLGRDPFSARYIAHFRVMRARDS